MHPNSKKQLRKHRVLNAANQFVIQQKLCAYVGHIKALQAVTLLYVGENF